MENKVPQTNVKFFFPDLHWPTKQMMVPISRIRRLARGNHVDLLIVTVKYKKLYNTGNNLKLYGFVTRYTGIKSIMINCIKSFF